MRFHDPSYNNINISCLLIIASPAPRHQSQITNGHLFHRIIRLHESVYRQQWLKRLAYNLKGTVQVPVLAGGELI